MALCVKAGARTTETILRLLDFGKGKLWNLFGGDDWTYRNIIFPSDLEAVNKIKVINKLKKLINK